MRVALAGLLHESNTFAVRPTGLDDFAVCVGEQLLRHYAGTYHELAGFIAGAEDCGFTPVPLLAAEATPSGPVAAAAYAALTGRLLDLLRCGPPPDGLLLALHGAMVAEGYPEADAETVRRVRAAMGPGFPLVVTHDYHANVPAALVNAADALVVYQTNPHVDQRERGLRAASILARLVRGQIRPTSALAKPELVCNIRFHNTSVPPMGPLLEQARQLERAPGILACSIAAGYQYADVPAMGPAIVVVADNDAERADREARRLADAMWAVRDQFVPEVLSPAAAVARAQAAPASPVTLLDLGDNVGGGSAGDATFVLSELLRQQAQRWVVTLFDPAAAQACARAGVGAQLCLEVGGHTDDQHGAPMTVAGRVRSIHEGTYEETERRHGGGRYFDQGLTAVLALGQDQSGGGLLVLNSRRAMPNSIHQITSCGIQPEQQRILVAKGAVAPRAAYEPVSAELIEVDSGGATAIRRSPEEYRRARPTLYEWRR